MRKGIQNFFGEFKTFVMRGNVLNLAVGVIIGAAFQAVVSSLSDNILSPLLGLFAGQNFDALQLEFLGITLRYGAFITSVIDFVIMAFVIFLIVKVMNKLMGLGKKHEEPETPPAPLTKACPYCLSDIKAEATRCPHCTSTLADSAT